MPSHAFLGSDQYLPARVDPTLFDYAAEDAAWNPGYAAGV